MGEVLSIIDRDQKKVDTFARQMMDVLNKAALSLMMSIGHQTGLFDIMSNLPPSTSKQIAAAAGLNERYVREWLGALVTGRIIDYEPSVQSYSLSPEHAVWLTRAAGTENIASQTQMIPILAAVALKMFKKFDLITAFDAIHIQAQPRIVLRRIANALRSDGTFLMVDFAASSRVEENLDHPLGPFMYTFSCMHCMTVSLAQDCEGLGAVWGEEKARQMLTKAGFTHIELKRIASDIFHNYYIASFRQPQK
jgi:SAM-dependent methyltransferase